MHDSIQIRKRSPLVGFLCLAVLAIILVAGLWPFRAPKNDVAWIPNSDGLFFGRHGSAVSNGSFSAAAPAQTLEIAFEPAHSKGRRTILAFDGAQDRRGSFSLQQDGRAFIVHRLNVDTSGVSRLAETLFPGVLSPNKAVVAAIVLTPTDTTVYLDGVRAGKSQISGVVTGGFAGRIVLANALTASDSWSGKISNFAIYNDQLSPQQIAQDFSTWQQGSSLDGNRIPPPAAVYRFNERTGTVVRNDVDASTNLTIPTRYFVLHPEFLSLPWHHYHPNFAYWEDVAVNIAGFIPFGFLLSSYFSQEHPVRNPMLLVIALGFFTSLFIEVSQAFLPTRDSGVNDLITNTLGTAIGVAMYRSPTVWSLLSRIPFVNRIFVSAPHVQVA